MDKSIYSPRSLRLAAHLKRLRVERNLTLQDVATKINRNHPYVIDYESGQRRLDIIQLTEVAWALGSSLTAVTEAVTRESLPNDEPAAGELSDFADPYGESQARDPDRDAWYQTEWSRLCALLRVTRENVRKPDGTPLRQEDVAARLDVPQSLVSKYETKNRRLDLVEFEHVAAALDTTAVDLARAFEGNARSSGTPETPAD